MNESTRAASAAPPATLSAAAPPAVTSGAASRAPIAITLGDACGIGPEIVLKAFATGLPAPCVVVGDAAFLAREAARLGLALDVRPVTQAAPGAPGSVAVIDATALPPDLVAGSVDARAGEAAFRCIERAARSTGRRSAPWSQRRSPRKRCTSPGIAFRATPNCSPSWPAACRCA
jgi:hypothetical protein